MQKIIKRVEVHKTKFNCGWLFLYNLQSLYFAYKTCHIFFKALLLPWGRRCLKHLLDLCHAHTKIPHLMPNGNPSTKSKERFCVKLSGLLCTVVTRSTWLAGLGVCVTVRESSSRVLGPGDTTSFCHSSIPWSPRAAQQFPSSSVSMPTAQSLASYCPENNSTSYLNPHWTNTAADHSWS